MNGPCRRHGVINRAELADRHGSKEHDLELNHTVPYGTGLFGHIPGNKLPGYLHSFPPGHVILTPAGFRLHIAMRVVAGWGMRALFSRLIVGR
jgi:hypothetical protein